MKRRITYPDLLPTNDILKCFWPVTHVMRLEGEIEAGDPADDNERVATPSAKSKGSEAVISSGGGLETISECDDEDRPSSRFSNSLRVGSPADSRNATLSSVGSR